MSEALNTYLSDIQAKVEKVFRDDHTYISGLDVTANTFNYGTEVEVKITTMYDYVPFTLPIMLKLAEIFGTMDYKVDQNHYDGCETCDYGSSYTKELYYHLPEEFKA